MELGRSGFSCGKGFSGAVKPTHCDVPSGRNCHPARLRESGKDVDQEHAADTENASGSVRTVGRRRHAPFRVDARVREGIVAIGGWMPWRTHDGENHEAEIPMVRCAGDARKCNLGVCHG